MELLKTKRGYTAKCAHITVRLKTHDLKEAKALSKDLASVELAHRAGVLTAATVQRLTYGRKITGQRALDAYAEHLPRTRLAPLTRHQYHQRVSAFLHPRLPDPINTVTEKQVDAYINPTGPIGAATRQNRRNALLSFFRFCTAKGFVLGNPAELVEVRLHELTHSQMEPTEKRPIFSVETEGLPVFWKVATKLAMEYGLRLSDTAQLEWASLATPGKLVVYTDKTRTRLEFDVSPELQLVLDDIPKTDPELCFPDQWETAQSPTRRALLSNQFKRLTGVCFHAIRHGFATRLALAGESVTDIQLRLGHASPRMTERYIHT